MFSWEKREIVIGRIPTAFVAVAGVEELVMMENGLFRFVWPDLERGMVNGLQGEIMIPEALFAPGPEEAEETVPYKYEEDLSSVAHSWAKSGTLTSVI